MKKRNLGFDFGKIFKKVDKRAALTTQQIVILIILITSFIVVLFFLFRLNLQETTDKEICHNSVVLRGNAVVPSETVPLNCKTNYVCITEDGSCEKLPYYNYRIDVDSKEELYEALAIEMADCWWMFGEGRVNYVGTGLTKSLHCSICSQITFDDSLLKIKGLESGVLNKNDFYMNYLARKKMTNREITYAQYLFGTNDLAKIIDKISSTDAKKVGSGPDIPSRDKLSFGTLDLGKTSAVMMGISQQVSTWAWIGIGAAAFLVGAIFAPVGVVVGAIIVAGGAGAGAITAVTVEGLSGNKYLAPTIITFPDEYDTLKCEHIETLG